MTSILDALSVLPALLAGGFVAWGGWLVLRSKLPERRRFRAGSGSGAARPFLYQAPSDSAARAVERPRSAAGSRAG